MKKLLSKKPKNSVDDAFQRLQKKEPPKKEIVKIIDNTEVQRVNNNELTIHQEFKEENPVLFGSDGSKQLDNKRWELFCRYYTEESEMFGNGVHSYAKAYNMDLEEPGKYTVAGALSCQLLKNVRVMSRINYLLDKLILNDAHVDKQMAYLITQNAQLQPKLGAIQEYNKLRNRIKERIDNQNNVIVFAPGQAEHFQKRDIQERKIIEQNE